MSFLVNSNSNNNSNTEAAVQMPHNFMRQIQVLRNKQDSLLAQRTALFWQTFSPQAQQDLFANLCHQLPELRNSSFTVDTLLNKVLSPYENKMLIMQNISLSPRNFAVLNNIWDTKMHNNLPAGVTELTQLQAQLVAVQKNLKNIDEHNILLQQLFQMYEHIMSISTTLAAMNTHIQAIKNDHVRENMNELFNTTKPILKTWFSI